MTKHYYILLLLLATCLQLNAQREELTVNLGWGVSYDSPSSVEPPVGVNIPGNWGDVKLTDFSFSAAEYPMYRIVLGKAVEQDGTVQIMVRNAAEAEEYGGHYYPVNAGQTVIEGEFDLGSFKGGDLVVTEFALQNMTGATVTVEIEDVVLISEYGDEVHTKLMATGWNPATFIIPGAPLKFTFQYATAGYWSGTVDEGTVHRFFINCTDTIADNFQIKITEVADDGTDTTYYKQMYMPEGSKTYAFDVARTYKEVSIQYYGTALPGAIGIESVQREVIADYPGESLPLEGGWGASRYIHEPVAPPVTVSIPGNWGDVKLADFSFSSAEYPMYKLVLDKPMEQDGIVQIMVRNAAEAEEYGGHYYPVNAGQTEIEGEFELDQFKDGDIVITEFALQNMTGAAVKVDIKDVILYGEYGQEVHPNLKATGWNPATFIAKEGPFGFSFPYASLGNWSGTVDEGTRHRITVYATDTIPADFQFTITERISAEETATRYVAIEPEPGSRAFSIDLDKDYTSVSILYCGQAGTAWFGIDKVMREVISDGGTGIADNMAAGDEVVERKYYSLSGALLDRPERGVNIVKETLPDGTTRTRKVITR